MIAQKKSRGDEDGVFFKHTSIIGIENSSVEGNLEATIIGEVHNSSFTGNIVQSENIAKSFKEKLQRIREQALQDKDLQEELSMYVPAMGAYQLNDLIQFELDEKIKQFITGEQKVFLLIGEAGSGKSIFSRYLERQLWENYKESDPIPLFISLPALQETTYHLIETYLKQYHFTEPEIVLLKKQRLLLFLDGYDELRQFNNLYVSNHLDQWNLQVIISCRTDYLDNRSDYSKFFAPYHHNKPQANLLVEMTVTPFSEVQIKTYIKKYLEIQQRKKLSSGFKLEEERFPLSDKPEWQRPETYYAYFGLEKNEEAIPGIRGLLENPFSLSLAMKVMPEVADLYSQEVNWLKRREISKAALYDIFISEWFVREENKLIQTASNPPDIGDIKIFYQDFCIKLALMMIKAELTHVTYIPLQPSLFSNNEKKNVSLWEPFFGNHVREGLPKNLLALIRRAVPIRKIGIHQYAFIHPALLYYFWGKKISLEATANIGVGNKDNSKYYRLTEDMILNKDVLEHKNEATANDTIPGKSGHASDSDSAGSLVPYYQEKVVKKRPRVNVEYQYEDNDIQAILSARLKQFRAKKFLFTKPIEILAAVDNIVGAQLESRLKQESNTHQGVRLCLVPCNLGNAHWVGILLEFDANGQALRAEYIDSLKAKPIIPETFKRQLNNVYPNVNFRIKESLCQNDYSSCGAYTVENLLAAALEVSCPVPEAIRDLHLDALKEYNPAFYHAFDKRQRNNRPTTADLHEQLGYLNRLENIWFSKQELNRILTIKRCLSQLPKEAQPELLLAFEHKSLYNDSHALHLNAIRMALEKASQLESKAVMELIELLFYIPSHSKTPTSLDNLKFRVSYSEILAISQGNITAQQISSLQQTLADQLRQDEEFAAKLQAELWNSVEVPKPLSMMSVASN